MAEVAAAARAAAPHPHLRARDSEAQETTAVELFFDLVYLLAVTQLSHLLLTHLSWASLGHTVFLLLVVWWAWIYTTRSGLGWSAWTRTPARRSKSCETRALRA
jgi:low temperature requirement protein LtrA